MSKPPIRVTPYRDLKDKLVGAPGTPERDLFDQELKAELDSLQIPVVILHIEGEGDFTITRENFDAYAADFKPESSGGSDEVIARLEHQLHACADDNGFLYADISSVIDMTQTRSQAELDALPEWGSF